MGVGLIVEALYDSLDSFDKYEYGSVLLITFVMTFYGMTPALAVGALCAATTFTLQVGNHVTPIRREMRARSLRSSLWRPEEATKVRGAGKSILFNSNSILLHVMVTFLFAFIFRYYFNIQEIS